MVCARIGSGFQGLGGTHLPKCSIGALPQEEGWGGGAVCVSGDASVLKVKSRPFQILLGNFLATFRILSNLFVREQLLATFRKTSTFLVTFGLF